MFFMKKLIFRVTFCTLSIVFIFFACSKENTNTNTNTNSNSFALTKASAPTNQDVLFEGLARVISIGVNTNTAFRELIKSKALEQFDGDYDVLLVQIKDAIIGTDTGKEDVKQFLGTIYATQFKEQKIYVYGDISAKFETQKDETGQPYIFNPNDIIEYIISLYPEVQVSVPIHAEDWKTNSYIPIVTYIQEEYNENTTKTLDGFLNNKLVALDAVNLPSEPVLVVGLCERLELNNNLMPPPNVTINLTATTNATGINLAWTVSNPNNDLITGYQVYRKTLLGANFDLLFSNNGKDNKIYNDDKVGALQNYYYYVKAYNGDGESDASNIATAVAPGIPMAVATFDAEHFVKNEIELRWSHPTQYIGSTVVSKRVIGVDADYKSLGTFLLGTNEYFDKDTKLAGKKVIYKAVENNNQGSSNPKYDFVDVPFRNVAILEPVKIHKIYYNTDLCSEIEGWLKGKPEFQVSVVKAGSSGDAGIVQKDLKFDMKYSNQTFDRKVLAWLPSNWMEVLTFQVVEVDGKAKIDLNVSAGFEKKDIAKIGFIKGNTDIKIEDITNSKNDEVGRMEHRYADPIKSILEFPQGGVKIELSN